MNNYVTFFLTIWLLTTATVTSLVAQSSKIPSRPLYQKLQQTLEALSRAESAREEAYLAGKQGPELETVRQQCRVAISQIRAIQTQFAAFLRQAYQQRPSQRNKNDWTPRELESLARHLKVQLARAYRNQALCYPAESADRMNALSLALDQLGEVVTLPLNDASVWQARVEQVVCLRLFKRHAQATKLVEHWLNTPPPENIASRLTEERIYLDLDAGNLTYALANNDPKLLSYAAASLYGSGKLNEAVATYDRLATLQAAEGHTDRQCQALKTAAAIVREMKRPAAALARFRKLALQHPRHVETTNVHLIAIGLAAELAREATPEQREEKFDFYVTLLKEHLQHWPKSPAAKKVQDWIARTELPEIDRLRVLSLVNQGNRKQALELYRKLIADAPDDAKLLEAYAELLARGKDEAERRVALQVWHTLEKRSKPGGLRWWRGRRARLTLHEQLGEGEQAKKLQQLTKILYPRIE